MPPGESGQTAVVSVINNSVVCGAGRPSFFGERGAPVVRSAPGAGPAGALTPHAPSPSHAHTPCPAAPPLADVGGRKGIEKMYSGLHRRAVGIDTAAVTPGERRGGRREQVAPLMAPLGARPVRVLLISHTCQSQREGHPRAEMLARMPGIELKVLTPDRWLHYGQWRTAESPAAGAGFDLHVGRAALPWAGPAQFYLHWYPGLARLIREFRPDIIDLWEEPWGLVSAQACWLRDRLLPSAKIVTETEQNINKRLPAPFEQFRAYTLRCADFAVGRSAEAVEVLRDKGYRGPAMVVPNGVDLSLFTPLPQAECRARLGLPARRFLAGYVGRLVEEKGLTDMVDALDHLSPEVSLVFAGGGALREELEGRAQAAGHGGRVHFLPARPQEGLAEVMSALDTLVLPSWTTPSWKEQFGRVIIEAHACGVPVIGSSSGAIPDVVGRGGLVFTERDPRDLASAVEALRREPVERTAMGRLGRRQAGELYSWGCVAAHMADVYCRLTGGHIMPAVPAVNTVPKVNFDTASASAPAPVLAAQRSSVPAPGTAAAAAVQS